MAQIFFVLLPRIVKSKCILLNFLTLVTELYSNFCIHELSFSLATSQQCLTLLAGGKV